MPDKRFFSRLENWVRTNRHAWPEIRSKSNWLRTARQAQELKGLELARRMAVSPARVSMLEREEERGAVTLKMMQRAAQALDCEFVYLLVPKNSLQLDDSQPPAKPRMRINPARNSD